MSTIKGLMKHPIIMETIKMSCLKQPKQFLQSKGICAGIISIASEHFHPAEITRRKKGKLTNDGNLLCK